MKLLLINYLLIDWNQLLLLEWRGPDWLDFHAHELTHMDILHTWILVYLKKLLMIWHDPRSVSSSNLLLDVLSWQHILILKPAWNRFLLCKQKLVHTLSQCPCGNPLSHCSSQIRQIIRRSFQIERVLSNEQETLLITDYILFERNFKETSSAVVEYCTCEIY